MYKSSREIKIGDILLGGDNPVTIQSMTNTDTSDYEATINQIKELESAGCEIVRSTVNTSKAAKAFRKIKDAINTPLIADIHFDYRLAIEAIDNGADGIRINPGNIGGDDRLLEVLKAAKINNTAIRIGVNSGSIEKELIEQYGVTSKALVHSALKKVQFFEDNNFYNFKVSLKASNVPIMVDAYREFAKINNAPLHLGVTEAGSSFSGTIKSSVGIGSLLLDGIGSTIRVSITGDPVQEIKIAKEILKTTGLRQGIDIISCPTCGRTEIALVEITEKVEDLLKDVEKPITVAVMGCVVNGPGEAKEADYGIAGGKGKGIIFAKGEIIQVTTEDNLLNLLTKVLKDDKII